MSNLIVSFVESSNHCIYPCIIFLGSCLVLFVSFGAYGHLDDKLEFFENGVRMLLLSCFRCWRFYRSSLRKGSHHFILGFFSHLLFLDISINIVLALVFRFPTNLVSSNSEFVCKSCGRFNFIGSRFSLPSAGARGP